MPFVKHQVLPLPEDSQILWRYMDFPKFVSLIQRKALFFSGLNTLKDDPWEGRPSKLNFDENRIVSVKSINGHQSPLLLKDLFNKPAIEEHKQGFLRARGMFFINCWHINDSESDSQWKIYGKSPFSMAIISSVSRLSTAIVDDKKIFGSKIHYYNPRVDTTPDGNAFFLAICKREAFVHEKEFRLIYCDFDLLQSSKYPRGVPICVDLKKMIEKVIISPLAPKWFIDEVEIFIRANGFSFSCIKSDLLDEWESF